VLQINWHFFRAVSQLLTSHFFLGIDSIDFSFGKKQFSRFFFSLEIEEFEPCITQLAGILAFIQ